MKDKNVAGILALLFGFLGIHRFYLGQTGLGIVYLIFCLVPIIWLIAFVDAILFFVMDKDTFDMKYNREHVDKRDIRRNVAQERRRERVRTYDDRSSSRRKDRPQTTRRGSARSRKPDPFKKTGIEKYKDYDFKGAIADFQKSLGVRPKDPGTHFYLACAYSMEEDVEKGFEHLEKAVQLGFSEMEKINSTDALAFLRIQPDYDTFKANGFRRVSKNIEGVESEREMDDLLLSKLKRLGDLKERGLISEDEFLKEKAKLLK